MSHSLCLNSKTMRYRSYRVTSYTWPCFSGTLNKVTCPLYTCTLDKPLFTRYKKTWSVLGWEKKTLFSKHYHKAGVDKLWSIAQIYNYRNYPVSDCNNRKISCPRQWAMFIDLVYLRILSTPPPFRSHRTLIIQFFAPHFCCRWRNKRYKLETPRRILLHPSSIEGIQRNPR